MLSKQRKILNFTSFPSSSTQTFLYMVVSNICILKSLFGLVGVITGVIESGGEKNGVCGYLVGPRSFSAACPYSAQPCVFLLLVVSFSFFAKSALINACILLIQLYYYYYLTGRDWV